MFHASVHGPITRLRMARTFFGKPLYEVSAYAYGGLLIDSGPPPTASNLVEHCRAHPEIRKVVLTHHHEDHVGGAAAWASLGDFSHANLIRSLLARGPRSD